MKYTDICTLDAQGRIVIPTKMRKTLNLVNQDTLEAELSGQEIHLRKRAELPVDTRRLSSLLTILYNSNRHTVALCSDMQVVSAVGSFLPDRTPVSKELSACIQAEKEYLPDMSRQIYLTSSPGTPVAALFPVHAEKPLALAVLSTKPLTEVEIGCARLVAATITHEFIGQRQSEQEIKSN